MSFQQQRGCSGVYLTRNCDLHFFAAAEGTALSVYTHTGCQELINSQSATCVGRCVTGKCWCPWRGTEDMCPFITHKGPINRIVVTFITHTVPSACRRLPPKLCIPRRRRRRRRQRNEPTVGPDSVVADVKRL